MATVPVFVARMTTPFWARVCAAACWAGLSGPQVTTRNLMGESLKLSASMDPAAGCLAAG